MGIAIAIIALIVVGAIVGATLNFAALFVAIPLALLIMAAAAGKESLDRQRRIMRMKRFRREARAQKVNFTPEDKQTLI